MLQDENGNAKAKGSSVEVGHLFFALTFKIGSFDFQVFQESRLVQKHYFDPYCKDEEQISFHLAKVEELLAIRGEQMKSTLELYDRRTASA